MALSSSAAIETKPQETIQQYPLAEFEEVVDNLIKESKPFTSYVLLQGCLATSIGALNALAAEKQILHDAIVEFENERKRTSFGESQSQSKELKTAIEELTAASTKLIQLPLQHQQKQEALRQAELKINADIIRQLDEEKLQTANDMKTKNEQVISLDREQTEQKAAIEAKQKEIDDKCCGCGCFPCCTKKERDEKVQLEAQLSVTTQKLNVLEQEVKTPSDPKAKSQAIVNLEQQLEASRAEAKKYEENGYAAELQQAQQTVTDLTAEKDKLELKLKNETKFFHAWVSNDLMLQLLRVYERFNQLALAVKSAHEINRDNKHLEDLNALCIDYKNDFYGLLELFWCANSSDKTGVQIYEALTSLSSEEQPHLFDKQPAREFLDKFLPNVRGRQLDALLNHEIRVRMNFFKPKHLTHAHLDTLSVAPIGKSSSPAPVH